MYLHIVYLIFIRVRRFTSNSIKGLFPQHTIMDNVDFSILKCIHECGEGMWKKRIHSQLEDMMDRMPLQELVSEQTVGRRVDALEVEGYLKTNIVASDEVARDLIIGYTVTPEGRQLLAQKRETLLREIVCTELFSDHDEMGITRRALADLANNEFRLEESAEGTVDIYSRRELLILLALYFVEKAATGTCSQEQHQAFRDIVLEERSPTDLFQHSFE